MRKTNETEKAPTRLEKSHKRIREQKQRTPIPTHKTRLKPLTREPKKSVFRARVKEYFNP
ncbi:hypothetical protein BTM312_05840 [Helicobacter pylori]